MSTAARTVAFMGLGQMGFGMASNLLKLGGPARLERARLAVACGAGSRYDVRDMRVDRIFEGGTLLTMDPARPRATALAVLAGRIVAVGDGDELRRHLDAERVVRTPTRANTE